MLYLAAIVLLCCAHSHLVICAIVGGFVINNRVMGELAVSRAFGDADFKKSIQVTHDDASPHLIIPFHTSYSSSLPHIHHTPHHFLTLIILPVAPAEHHRGGGRLYKAAGSGRYPLGPAAHHRRAGH